MTMTKQNEANATYKEELRTISDITGNVKG